MLNQIMPSVRATLVMAIYVGIAYPLIMTGLSQVIFPHQANGSLITDSSGKIVGSEILAQGFNRPEYFHPRPSAAGSGYAGEASGGTNLGPTSAKLIEGIKDDPATKEVDESFKGVKQLAEAYRQENSLAGDAQVPVDAVTRSGSGLDPHISIANALLQAPRVARARGLSEGDLHEQIRKYSEERTLGFLGEPRVNVLLINLALDQSKPVRATQVAGEH